MRRAAVVVMILSAPALAGCRTEVHVGVLGAEDGSGTVNVTVELDPEASAALGGGDRVVLDDLLAAGWSIEDAKLGEDGGLTFSGSRRFRDAEELQAVLTEIGTTADGTAVFSDTDYVVSDGFGRAGYEMSTTVNVSGDPSQFGDDALTEVLGGVPLGWTAEELAALGATEPGAGELAVELRVPEGGADSARFDLTGGLAAQERLEADARTIEPLVWVLVVVGAVAVLAAIVSGFRAWRARS